MPGEGCDLTAVGRLVQCVDDDGQSGLVAEPVEQRLQGVDIVDGSWNVRAFVRAETRCDRGVVVTPCPDMELQDQPVVHAHCRHLDQHLRTEVLSVARFVSSAVDAKEELLCVMRREICRARRGVPMIRGGGAIGDEVGTPGPERVEVPMPARRVHPGEPPKCRHIGPKVSPVRVDDIVGSKGRNHTPLPGGTAELGVLLQLVEGAIGGGQEFDPEPFEESTRTEVRLRQPVTDLVVDVVSRLGTKCGPDSQHLPQGMFEPEPRRCAQEEPIVPRQCTPDLPAFLLGRRTVERLHAERLEGDALTVQESKDVMIFGHQFGRGVAECRVPRQCRRVTVPMGAHDRQGLGALVESAGDGADARFSWEESVFVQHVLQSFA